MFLKGLFEPLKVKKLSECLEPLSLSELWEPLCRTDGSNPYIYFMWASEFIRRPTLVSNRKEEEEEI